MQKLEKNQNPLLLDGPEEPSPEFDEIFDFPISYSLLTSDTSDQDIKEYIEKYIPKYAKKRIPHTKLEFSEVALYLHNLLSKGGPEFKNYILQLFHKTDIEGNQNKDLLSEEVKSPPPEPSLGGALKSSAFFPLNTHGPLQIPAPLKVEETDAKDQTSDNQNFDQLFPVRQRESSPSRRNSKEEIFFFDDSPDELILGSNLSDFKSPAMQGVKSVTFQDKEEKSLEPSETFPEAQLSGKKSLQLNLGGIQHPSHPSSSLSPRGQSPQFSNLPSLEKSINSWSNPLNPDFIQNSISKSWSNISKFEKLLPDVSTTEEKTSLPSDYEMLHVIPPSAYFKTQIASEEKPAPPKKAKRDTLDWFSFKIIGSPKNQKLNSGIVINYEILNLCANSNGYGDFLLRNEIADQISELTQKSTNFTNLNFTYSGTKKGASIKSLQEVLSLTRGLTWDEKRFKAYLELFLETLSGLDWQTEKVLRCIEAEIQALQYLNDAKSLEFIERLLIGLLGDTRKVAREAAARDLNVIYDGHYFQSEEALIPVVRTVGDNFIVEFDVSEFEESAQELSNFVYLIVRRPAEERTISVHKPHSTDITKPLRISLDAFDTPGFYDWAWALLDPNTGYFKTSHEDIELSKGRVIVQPAELREKVFHQLIVRRSSTPFVHVDPLFQVDSFFTAANSLKELKLKFGVTHVCILGALSDSSGDGLSSPDRTSPSPYLGGWDGFNHLLNISQELDIKLIVDSLHRISIRNFHRKYRNCFCQSINEDLGAPVIVNSTDGREMIWKDSAQLNFRKKEVWDLWVDEVLFWSKFGVSGVRIDDAHILPTTLKPNNEELLKVDTDKELFYSHQEILEGIIIQSPTSKGYQKTGFWSTASSQTYPNPFFSKLIQHIWKSNSHFLFLANVSWNRELNAISSGLIIYSSHLPEAVRSVFNIQFTPKGLNYLTGRTSVQPLYNFYQYQRPNYPQNSFLLFPSSAFNFPSPVNIFGAGAWTKIDLLYFLPEGPSTCSTELLTSQLLSQRALVEKFPERLREIQGHYEHRSQLRKNFPVLRSGGFIPLFAFWGNGWHDNVFTFARLTQEEPLNLAIIAINFNDSESIVYIDTSPLKEFIEEKHQNDFFRVTDLINQTTPPQFFKREEFLNEKNFLVLKPYESICQGVWVHPQSVSSDRLLFDNSVNRLYNHLKYSTDPAYNTVYEQIYETVQNGVIAIRDLFQSLSQKFLGQFKFSLSELLQQTFYLICSKDESMKLRILVILEKIKTNKTWKNYEDAITLAKNILIENVLGPIVFITPEIGRFSTVGGVGVMVNELTQTLTSLGCKVHVISPYYNYNRKGETDYLKKDGFIYKYNIGTGVGHQYIEMGVWSGIEHGVELHFLHNYKYFISPYFGGSSETQTETLSLFAKGSLECLCQMRILPSLIITNDWFAGLVPAYAKRGNFFGNTFSGATTVHLIHNLEEGYEGKVYSDSDLGYITQLPHDIILDWGGVINPSFCALKTSDQWATVSNSYKEDLLKGSSLSPLLRSFKVPFAQSNGVRVKDRLNIMAKVALSHEEAKEILQKKYFGKYDPSIPIFSFVGRIVLQKGVHLILNAMDELNHFFYGKVQFIIGGMANKSDPYAGQCAWRMEALRKSCPHQFWADPTQFFTDGPLLNIGSDFGLMPSLFEPSGVVQQEYFAGSTPVIAFLTGGLKDTVSEFLPHTGKGNGFTFLAHDHRDYVDAIKRAVNIFNNPQQYALLRKNARESVLDVEDVAAIWISEFTRLRKRFWAKDSKIKEILDQEKKEEEENEKEAITNSKKEKSKKKEEENQKETMTNSKKEKSKKEEKEKKEKKENEKETMTNSKKEKSKKKTKKDKKKSN